MTKHSKIKIKRRTNKSSFLFTELLVIIIFLLLNTGNKSFGQQNKKVQTTAFAERDTLITLGKILLNPKVLDDAKIKANNQFESILRNALSSTSAFEVNLDSVLNLAIIKPEDLSFIIYNWELPLSNNVYQYYAFIVTKNSKNNTVQLYKLTAANNTGTKKVDGEIGNWYGGHYYKVITKKHKRKKYYTLLSANWDSKISKKKIIDILTIDKEGKPKFGAPIINYNKTLLSKLVFEYTNSVSMSVRYDEPLDLIIFDHLSPIQPDLKGQYQFYAPDLSYDALKFKKGKWIHIENLDARNSK